MCFDGPHTDKAGRGRVAIRRAACDEIGDPLLGCGQLGPGRGPFWATLQFPFDLCL
jgi:hypothetical protein